jgi:hypothetical protein
VQGTITLKHTSSTLYFVYILAITNGDNKTFANILKKQGQITLKHTSFTFYFVYILAITNGDNKTVANILKKHSTINNKLLEQSTMTKVAPSVFVSIGLKILSKSKSARDGVTINRRWRALFGASPAVCSLLWAWVDPPNNPKLPENSEMKHLMWALMFLRDYNVEENHATLTGADEKTYRKWQWLFVPQIAILESRVIKWEGRRVDDIQNDAMSSVDGTDCKVPNYKPFWKGFFSHKITSGVRWEVALCLRTGEIVWIHGPFPCGRWPDIEIFRHSMLSHLDEGEKVEADDGYIGEPTKTLTPKNNTLNKSDAEYRQYTRARQESVNKRFKDWKCLKHQCRHGLKNHSAMFRAVAVISQFAVTCGEPLFQIDYDDENFSLPL